MPLRLELVPNGRRLFMIYRLHLLSVQTLPVGFYILPTIRCRAAFDSLLLLRQYTNSRLFIGRPARERRPCRHYFTSNLSFPTFSSFFFLFMDGIVGFKGTRIPKSGFGRWQVDFMRFNGLVQTRRRYAGEESGYIPCTYSERWSNEDWRLGVDKDTYTFNIHYNHRRG
ncbi:hypothetical protein QBC37DRAFT_428124 [Rhypophila decipiens]|uniref:Uncharacterized protein n=1 Tax=Rhypophila decipiens TaxID=261697 RepID=A0AAN6Y1R9_9PEZI|nr:hypothetical protein QBC37DRAFT_428124 [Rhypophila decipiens]